MEDGYGEYNSDGVELDVLPYGAITILRQLLYPSLIEEESDDTDARHRC